MRTSGVLMPISSLPSPYGIGTMGKAARKFVDFLKITLIIIFRMDTQNYVKIASYALLANLRNKKDRTAKNSKT